MAHRLTLLSSFLAFVKFALFWSFGLLLQISYLSFLSSTAGMILSASSLNQLLCARFSVGMVKDSRSVLIPCGESELSDCFVLTMVSSYSDFAVDVSSDDDGGRGWSPMKRVVVAMTPPWIGGGLPALSHALSALGERSTTV
eukprot:scaffold209438_cov40-Attheya_sp.AAC.1